MFDYLADPRNRPEWQSSLRSVDLLDDGPPREGFRWRETMIVGVRPTLTIIECDRPRAWAERGTWQGVAATLRLDFGTTATSCEVVASGTVEGRGPWAIAVVAAGALAGRAITADLRNAGRILTER